jgi:transposase
MTGPLFQRFISTLHIPHGSYLVTDNARIHHAGMSLTRAGIPTISATLHARGVEPLYLPPYSPDLAPVELIFNSMRTTVDAQQPRTEQQLRDAIHSFIDGLTSADVLAAFRHAWSGQTRQ